MVAEMKAFAVTTAALILIVVTAYSYLSFHVRALELNRTIGFSVQEARNTEGNVVLRINGSSGDDAYAVKRIEARTQGDSIDVIVQLTLIRFDRTGIFSYELPVPPGVRVVRYGKSRTVIWARR